MIVVPMNWHERVEVQVFDQSPVLQTGPDRILWRDISLAEAVRRWVDLPADVQARIEIFGTDLHSGAAIAQLALRSDFPEA